MKTFLSPADPVFGNFSFTVVDGKIYYRENSRMNRLMYLLLLRAVSKA